MAVAPLSLAQLAALADEIAALVRAGIPLDRGLRGAEGDLATPGGKVAQRLAARLEQGQPLPQAIAAEQQSLPPLFFAVVNAGLRAGNLPAALEGLAVTARRAADVRRQARAALVYPLLLAVAALGLFVFSLTRFQPLVMHSAQRLRIEPSAANVTLSAWGNSAAVWAPILIVALLVIVAWLWLRSRRAGITGSARRWPWSPVGRLIQYGRMATFADVLALLIEQLSPLDEALPLAAEASGDGALVEASHRLATAISAGASAGEKAAAAKNFPPLLGWLLASGPGSARPLIAALRSSAEGYRRQAQRLELHLRLWLPLVLTAVIGGGAVLALAVSQFLPWYQVLEHGGAMLR